MLRSYEMLFSILIPWIIAEITHAILKRRKGESLPPGSFASDYAHIIEEEKAPGTRWSRSGIMFNSIINDLILTFVVILCIFDSWNAAQQYIAIDFPIWLNWLGIFGLWFQYAWQVAILTYNINFTLITKPIKPRYILATGGPYKLVRHPTYVNIILVTFFLFFATGIWAILIGAIGWLTLPRQARAEEKAMELRFGKIYADYAARTGRFFPIIWRHKID